MNQHPAYELFEELGRGSNTVVYRSYDLSLGREVAIKELDENSRRDPRQRERFLREAQFLAQFEHDNVLRVYSVDPERGWIVMELMKGTLASIIAAGPSDPDLVRSVLKQTLEALAFLHEKNKVHGTVRPTNLLINDAGRVKLSEFEQTAVGGELRAPKGSKKYLAPELIKPEFGGFGPPLDLYCLGFTALELLKGPQFDTLFPGTGKGAIDADIAWLRWHSSPDELPPAKKLIKNIPDDLAHVLDHMLKKRVADRPQSAHAVLKELADRPLVAVPIDGIVEGAAVEANGDYGPAVVRTISEPQAVTPRGPSPAVGGGEPAMPRYGTPTASAKPFAKGSKTKSPAKPVPPRFSKDWWNYQIGKPYVLYPLCALIILGAFFFSFGNPFGGKAIAPVAKKEEAKTTTPEVPSMIPVSFNVKPDAEGLEVIVGDKPVTANPEGKYLFAPGHHSVTLKKEGFKSATRDVEISTTSNKFNVEFKPEVKMVDVTVQVTPATAELKVGGKKQSLTNGSYTQKIPVGQPLQIEITSDKFEPISRTVSADEIKTLGNKIAFNLKPLPQPVPPAPEPIKPEPIKPEPPQSPKYVLPATLVARPDAPEDPETQLPVRALSKRLINTEPMEFALVKTGKYKFGAPGDKRRPLELKERTVTCTLPYYIALHETTNAQYQRFSLAVGDANAGTRWQTASRKWATPHNLDPVRNKLPVANVTPEQAELFRKWAGGQLPTEIEWESAVRGLDDAGFPYPWGKEVPTRERCRTFYGAHLERGEGGPVPVENMLAGANKLGMTHALGNVAEWCLDSEEHGKFILRGCSITTANIDDIRVTWRAKGDPKGEESTGFRVCVPVRGPASKEPLKPTAAAVRPEQPVPQAQPSANDESEPGFSWEKVYYALTSPSSDSETSPASPPKR
jgi:serine/threonine-protein kinase